MPQKGGLSLRYRVCFAIISGIVRTMLCFISSFVHLIHIYIYIYIYIYGRGVPKIRGIVFGIPIIRMIVFWCLYIGSPIYGRYHIKGTVFYLLGPSFVALQV